MPKLRSAKSLRDASLRRIALSFDSYWMSHFDEHFQDIPRLLYVIGPFDNLVGETIQQMIDHLIAEKCLKRRHFICLMQESLTVLNLSKGGTAANNDTVLHTVMNRCPKLVSLNLQGLNSLSVRCIMDVVKTLPGLRVLNLTQTSCNDQVLSVIGHHCRDMLDLDVSVTKITNMGAFSLCQAFSRDPNMGCMKLLQLKIFSTMINPKGAVHLIQNLPNLQYLGFDDICGIIELDCHERETIPEFHPVEAYKLRNLFAHGIKVHPVTKTSIELGCKLCPDTVEARLYCCVTNDNICHLKSLKNLVNLDVGNSEGLDLTFLEGLLPVLVEIGPQLRELTIADVNDFDLLSIGHYCRKLTKLSILLSGQFEYVVPPLMNHITHEDRQVMFDQLRHLALVYPLEEINFQRTAFIMMLKNARSLKTLTIHYMQSLTTEMLFEVIAENPLNDLEDMNLVSCDKLGAGPIEMMLKGDFCISLSRVDLKNCRSIAMQDFEKLKTVIKSKGYDIKITWT